MLQQVFQKPDGLGIVVAVGQPFVDGQTQIQRFLHGGAALADFGENFKHTLGSYTAGGAFAAGFVADEFHIELRNVNHAVVLVHNDCAAGAHHGAERNKVIKVYGSVKLVLDDTAAGGAACLDCFEALAVGNSAADVENKLAQGGSHGNLHKADVVYLAAQCEHLGSLGTGGAVFGEFLNAFAHYVRNGGKGFNVINNGGAVPKSFYRRERRTGARHSALTLNGVEQGGFLAADERARAKADMGAEVKAASENVVAEKSLFLRHFNGVAQVLYRGGVLCADVEVAF